MGLLYGAGGNDEQRRKELEQGKEHDEGTDCKGLTLICCNCC